MGSYCGIREFVFLQESENAEGSTGSGSATVDRVRTADKGASHRGGEHRGSVPGNLFGGEIGWGGTNRALKRLARSVFFLV